MIKKFAFSILLLLFAYDARAQIKYNYIVGPGKTTCDSLDLKGDDFSTVLEKLQNAKWRYSQSMHLHRPYGFRSADYYSCDVNTGYLVVLVDSTNYIYTRVPIDVWTKFTQSSDPDDFIDKDIKNKFDQIK